MTIAKKKTSKPTDATEVASPVSALSRLLSKLLEPTTLAGVATIGASVATGGVAAWLNPTTLPVILAGLGLIAAPDKPLGTRAK